LSARSTAPASPYKGLSAFEDTDLDALLFFGRERERDVIVANLLAARLTIFYGPSGVGKSSLLLAGVAHELRRQRLEVVVYSSWSDEPPFAEWAKQRDVHVILDQFEEYFLYRGDDDRFAAQLADALVSRGGPNFLLSLREDALARLDAFKARIPNVFGNYLRLDRLDRNAARAAIVGPVARWNELVPERDSVQLEPGLVEAVLDEVEAGKVDLGEGGRGAVGGEAEGRIEAPFLQLVLQTLWETERQAGSQTLRLETLRRLGGAEQIVREHLERALDALTPVQKDVAATMFRHLVTPSGTKIAHVVGDLADFANVGEADLAPVLSTLGHERILRPVGGDSSDGARYEIFHDVLADAVLAWRARRELERQRQDAERRHRRTLIVAAAALVALAVVAAVAIFALTQRTQARAEARKAEAEARTARADNLAATAVTDLNTNPLLSLALAVLAARLDPTVQVEHALRSALIDSHVRVVLPARGAVLDAAFSPDGQRVVTASEDGRARLYTPSGRLVATLLHRGPVTRTIFTPDSRLVLTASKDKTAKLWDARSGRLVRVLHHDGAVNDAAFSDDGRVAATASHDRTARLWEIPSGNPLTVFLHERPVRRVSINGDGSLVATVAADVQGHLQARLFRRFGGSPTVLPQLGVRSARFSPDGQLLVTASANRTAVLWETSTGAETFALGGARNGLLDAVFSPEGKLVATASADGVSRLYLARTGRRIQALIGHTNAVTSLAFSPDGNWLVTASPDRTARIWATTTGHPGFVLVGDSESITSASFSPNGSLVITSSSDGAARIWDAGTEPELHLLDQHSEPVTTAAFSPDGRRILTASADGTARLWAASPRRLLTTLQQHGAIRTAAFSPDSRFLVTGGDDRHRSYLERQRRTRAPHPPPRHERDTHRDQSRREARRKR